MKLAVLLISSAIGVWVVLAISPIKMILFGRHITFDYGVRRQCGALTAALLLAAAGYACRPRLLIVLTVVTGAFLLAEWMFQYREDAGKGSSQDRHKPSVEGDAAAPARRQTAPNLFHLVLQLLLLANFVLQCLLLRG